MKERERERYGEIERFVTTRETKSELSLIYTYIQRESFPFPFLFLFLICFQLVIMVIFIKHTQMCVGVEEYTYVTSVSFFNDPTRSCVLSLLNYFFLLIMQFGPMTLQFILIWYLYYFLLFYKICFVSYCFFINVNVWANLRVLD
jgi:hypothetical protein